MHLKVRWHRALPVVHEEGIYTAGNLEDFDGVAGVYVFCRVWGTRLVPLYIGQATNIARRIPQQLNNHRLMNEIERSGIGEKVVLIGEYLGLKGQMLGKALEVIEKALIRHALSNGYPIFNRSGTRIRSNRIDFEKNLKAQRLFGRTILSEIRR